MQTIFAMGTHHIILSVGYTAIQEKLQMILFLRPEINLQSQTNPQEHACTMFFFQKLSNQSFLL